MTDIGNSYRGLLLAFFLITRTFAAWAQPQNIELTDSSKISLLTCSPGEELYSIFGHSAIRVSDPLLGLDITFNYGTFDFSDPHFYRNFVIGKLNYILSVSHFHHFYLEYALEDRWIFEQKLNIDQEARQHLLDSLLSNYQPENRFYLYDFFFDNCATRIRNVFVEALPDSIGFNYENLTAQQTFRQLLMPYLQQAPWARLGINLLLGLPADRVATPWEYMFLPDHMETLFGQARFNDTLNTPFAKAPEVLLEGKYQQGTSSTNYPLVASVILMAIILAITYWGYKRKACWIWIDRLFMGLVGLLGVLLAFMWLFTDHVSMVWNLNVLWANPFHVVFVFLLNRRTLAQWYGMANAIILFLLAVAWPFLPQQLPYEAYPIVIALLVRFVLLARHKKK